MRWLRPMLSFWMAVLVSITSMGMAVSSHTCSESGYEETGIGHLKTCCKLPTGKGIQSEPCCKVKVSHVKLATVRQAVAKVHVQFTAGSWAVLPMARVGQPLVGDMGLQAPVRRGPPDGRTCASGRDYQYHYCQYRI